MTSNVENNLAEVKERINNALNSYKISAKLPQKTKLIAVTKRQPHEKIKQAINAGHYIFGENKVQEAYTHFQELKQIYPQLELHFIGSLQTNKVKECLKLFDAIHTIDRVKLANKIKDALDGEFSHKKDNIKLFIQVNTGNEPQKAGVLTKDAEGFINYCINDLALNICGLMCIPPADENPAIHFLYLKKLADKFNLAELSMGMSADYELATAMGATYVRVGTEIFGKRKDLI